MKSSKRLSVGQRIRSARGRRDLTRAEAAEKLGISAGYLGHLENDNHVHLSEAVLGKIRTSLQATIPAPEVESHNDAAREWYRSYRKARAAAAPKVTKKKARRAS